MLFKGQYRKECAWFSLGASSPLVSMDADRLLVRFWKLFVGTAGATDHFRSKAGRNCTGSAAKCNGRPLEAYRPLVTSNANSTQNKTLTDWESGSTLSPSLLRELLIQQRSHTMASGIILGHADPLEPRIGPQLVRR